MNIMKMFPFADSNHTDAALAETAAFLIREPKICNRIAEMMWAYNDLGSLIPQTLDKFGSGHYFPFCESEFELGNAFLLAQRGFYRYAFIGLRNVLELGLLSVYWDRSDKAEDEIIGWMKSIDPTPFKAEVLKGLRSIETVKEFEKSFDLGDLIDNAYQSLNDFTHVRGYKYSSSRLNKANFVQFNDDSFRRWAHAVDEIIPLLVIVHLLKYPVGLQYTPLDEKFGLNGPIGGFLNPWQADKVRAVLRKEYLSILQGISDADKNAAILAAWVNQQPDISKEQFDEQVRYFDNFLNKSASEQIS